MSTDSFFKIIDNISSSLQVLAVGLGLSVSASEIRQIGLSSFPKSMQEYFIVQLIADMCRAYSGDAQPLTADLLVGKVRRLIPANSFRLERELKQCAACCVPRYDDLRPHTALLALDSSRFLNNQYQSVFGVVLTIEVLARIAKYDTRLRTVFDELCGIILYCNCNTAVQVIEKRLTDILEIEEAKKQIEHDCEVALSAQILGEHYV